MVISISTNPLESFNNFVFWLAAIISSFLYFTVYHWKNFKIFLVENNILSFNEEGLFIIQPLANYEWIFLLVAVLCGLTYIFLMYKTFIGQYDNDLTILVVFYTLVFSSTLFIISSPLEWYYLLIGFVWIALLLYILIKFTINCISDSITIS
jgi:hypothetical protein